VDGNTLTDQQTLQEAIEAFLSGIFGPHSDRAAAIGGRGGASMTRALKLASREAAQTQDRLQQVLQDFGDQHPLVVGGGIGTLLGNPTTITGDSEVNGNTFLLQTGSKVTTLGGGIFAARGDITIDHSRVNENVTSQGSGGGLWNGGGLVTIDHGTVADNTANGDGGGLFNSPRGQAMVSDSTFRGNTATGNGGGIANLGKLKVSDSTVGDNTATGNGGGIYTGRHYKLVDVVFDPTNSPDNLFVF
jgi:hypothetical protein